MPSLTHELLVHVLREHPGVVLELLARLSGQDYGGAHEVMSTAATLAELEPAEYRADVVLRLRASSEVPASALVVEVQLQVDDDKRFVWPLYVAGLRARLRCPVALVVLTLDERVARWAAVPIGLDERGSVLRPWVVGPSEVPAITQVADAAALPELALLSVLAHGREPGAERLGRALLEASRDLDDARARLYTDIAFAFLDDAARAILEAELQLPGYTYQSEFARRFVTQGREEGREEGRIETLVAAILEVLDARGIPLDDGTRARITACTDAAVLRGWFRGALTAVSAEALVGLASDL